RTQQRQVTSMEAGLETRFDGNPLHFRILTGYAGLCRQQCPMGARGGFCVFVALQNALAPLAPREGGVG
ncbi:MAG: hypothetical protein ACK5A3_01935, partial [Planctomyces sp.]